MFLHVKTKLLCIRCSNCCAHKTCTRPHRPLWTVIKGILIHILFTAVHNFVTPSRSRVELLHRQLQVSLCGWVCAYLFVHVYLSGKLSFSLANWITLLQAKSLSTEIKQLCLVVMVHKILFKIRIPSRSWQKGDNGNRKGALGVQYLPLRLHWSQLIRTCLSRTWSVHFKHHWHTVHGKGFNWRKGCAPEWERISLDK